MSGASGVLVPVGLFLLGIAATAWYGNVTGVGGVTVALVSCVLGVIALSAAAVLLLIRRSDVDRIKSETEFPTPVCQVIVALRRAPFGHPWRPPRHL